MMADIGEPLKRYIVVPLSEPVPDTGEPREAPIRQREPAPAPQIEPGGVP